MTEFFIQSFLINIIKKEKQKYKLIFMYNQG